LWLAVTALLALASLCALSQMGSADDTVPWTPVGTATR
jgi:hypothetical protein